MRDLTDVTSLANANGGRLKSLLQITNAALFLMISVFIIQRLTTLGLAQPPWPAILALLLTGANRPMCVSVVLPIAAPGCLS
jgi:lipopolysaccharide export LptBFGC system permease protein LptF